MRKASMEGQTVFITGTSSGIGKAAAEMFASLGANLVITARRKERLDVFAGELSSKYGIQSIPIELDVRNNEAVEAVFKQLEQQKVDIDVLVNNAGLALSTDRIQEGKVSNWDTMIDTNIKGLLYVTKAALPTMIQRNRGHIINIGSVAGQGCYLSGNVYCATKHAVRAISKSLRLDLMGTAIRVSEIAPGAVHTEFSEVRWNDKKKSDQFYGSFVSLTAEDIADAIVYCATRPSHVNVSEMVIFPQAQASLTDIYRGEASLKDPFIVKGKT